MYQVFIKVPGDYRNHRVEYMGHMGHERGAHQPTRGGAPPRMEGGQVGEGKEGVRPPFPSLLPLPFPSSGNYGKGGGRIGEDPK